MERGRIIADDIRALLRARNPLIWIVTREESPRRNSPSSYRSKN
jgi:hypothetical protein